MRIKGEELKSTQTVYVNGRRIAADIVELDTVKGWVKIELPELPNKANDGNPNEGDPQKDMIPIRSKVLILNGNVEVRDAISRTTRN